jgi:hypothetical protein
MPPNCRQIPFPRSRSRQNLFSTISLNVDLSTVLLVALLVVITINLSIPLLLAILEEHLNQARLHDLPALITRLLELEPMIDDDDELVVLQAGVKETKTAKLSVGLDANANEEGLLFGGGPLLGGIIAQVGRCSCCATATNGCHVVATNGYFVVRHNMPSSGMLDRACGARSGEVMISGFGMLLPRRREMIEGLWM